MCIFAGEVRVKQEKMNETLKNSASGRIFRDPEIFVIALVALLIRLVLMNFAQEVDADAVSRVFSSWEWAKSPYWFKTSVWAPFHYYLVGSGLLIWKDILLLPKILNILLSVLMLFPFYYFVRREFNRAGAVYATISLTLSPILFRLGFLCLAEIPGLFFMITAMNFLSKGIRENKNHWMALSGVAMTIAAGFRYESWLIILLFALIIMMGRRWKGSLTFLLFALIFTVIWMLQNYLSTGDPLFSFHANTDWTHISLGINDNVDFEAYLRRLWFYPFSFLIAVGPIAAWIIIRQTGGLILKFRFNRLPDLWLVPFLLFFGVMLYNSVAGNLLLQHRFTGTLVVLSLPWIAAVLKDFEMKTIRTAIISLLLMIGLSFVYTIGGTSPVPRLKNQAVKELVSVVQKATTPETVLVVDFIGWEDTWYTGLHSGAEPSNILMLASGANIGLPADRLKLLLDSSENKMLIIRDDSDLHLFLRENQELVMDSKELYRKDQVALIQSGKIAD